MEVAFWFFIAHPNTSSSTYLQQTYFTSVEHAPFTLFLLHIR